MDKDKRPGNSDIVRYLKEYKPFGGTVSVKSVSFLGGGNHCNYKVVTNKGSFVVRVGKVGGLGAGALFDIPDEFAILKLVGKSNVAPKALIVDLERFSSPLLIESHLNGIPYTSFKKLDAKRMDVVIDLMVKVSCISLDEKTFPFRFSYNFYNTNIRAWNARLDEVKQPEGNKKLLNDFIRETNKIIRGASNILLGNQSVLDGAKKVFIYNDVHAGNIFWQIKTKKALFIDWQKVSKGDPAFMPAVFALAFENKAGIDRDSFFEEVIEKYSRKGKIKNLKKLFWLRILEREVANMIWVVWASTKTKKSLPFNKVEKYDRFVRTRTIVDNFPY